MEYILNCLEYRQYFIYFASTKVIFHYMIRSLLLIIVSIFLFNSPLDAQDEILTLRHLGGSKDMPNSPITNLFQDSKGFLWIGTTSGLFRFDGYSSRCIGETVGTSTGALMEQILNIQEDGYGRLWIISESHTGIYDPETNTYINSISDYLKDFGISGNISSIIADNNGDIWIAIPQDGVYQIRIKDNKAKKADGDSLSRKTITNMTMSKDKIVGITPTGSIVEVNPKTLKVRFLSQGPDDSVIESPTIKMYADNTGLLWITNHERLMLFDLDSDTWLNDRLPNSGYIGVVKKIFQDSKDNTWIMRDNHGIEKLISDEGRYTVCPVKTEGDFIPGATIYTMIEDQNGTLIFGSYKFGLYTYNESVNKFRTLSFTDMNKTLDVNCMIASQNGSVWIGTDNAGLWLWNPADNKSVFIPDASEETISAITCLTSSPDNRIFIGKFAKGLYEYQNGQIRRHDTNSDIENSYVWGMDFDKKGTLWIGTLGNGVFKYDPQRHTSEHFNSTNSGLGSDFIISMVISKDGNIYMGTNAGLYKYNPIDRKITPVTIAKEQSFSDNKIIQIFEDSRELLWILTTSGLKVLDRNKANLHHIKSGNSIHGSNALGIIEDNKGDIWVSKNSKLTKYKVHYDEKSGALDISQLEYDTFSGLPEYDFNQRSFLQLQDGRIAVGHPFGIIYFNPKDIRKNTNKPTVFFTDLYVGNQPIAPGEKIHGRVALNKDLFSGEQIQFNHNPKEFTIFFASDNYALPEKTRFKYRLEGYSDQWQECPEGINYVTYTNLSPGNYQLQVIAINEDGYESESPASLEIKIHHPFWGSMWAWIIYVLLIISIIYSIVLIVKKNERRIHERQTEKENQRKQEELNQLKFNFFTNVSHDLRTPLTLIVSPLDDMIKESNDERLTKRLNQMRKNAMRLLSLVNQLLDFRKSEEANLHINLSEGDIVDFVHNVCNLFVELSESKNINLTFYSSEPDIELMFDKDKMEKIIMNLLGNSFKFTPAGGRIDIAIELDAADHSKLRIQVADTGIGIKDKEKKLIFNRFYQGVDAESHTTGTGIGLSMVSEYVRLHDGTIRVTDNVERGSVFIIEIPIRHSTTNQFNSPIEESKTGENSETEATSSVEKITKPLSYERKTVLIVDDNTDMTDMLKDSLENKYDVLIASDGIKALKIAVESRPDIILTDIMMPKMNGIELCRTLKEKTETVNIPIIILTAKHDLGVKLEGLTIGADDYITKPFNLEELRLRMNRLIELNSKGARRSLIEPEPDNIVITPLDEKLIEKAMKYVSQNISNPELSVEELSSVIGMSRVSLYKKIKQITGKSPIEFIRIIRLKRAAQLLRESQLNVSEIAYKTGFNNPKMFSKYFKEEFGILPSLYQSQQESTSHSNIMDILNQ